MSEKRAIIVATRRPAVILPAVETRRAMENFIGARWIVRLFVGIDAIELAVEFLRRRAVRNAIKTDAFDVLIGVQSVFVNVDLATAALTYALFRSGIRKAVVVRMVFKGWSLVHLFFLYIKSA